MFKELSSFPEENIWAAAELITEIHANLVFQLSGPTLRPPYLAIGYSYTYRIYVFQGIAGYCAIPPLGGGIAQLCWCFESTWGGVSQVKAALSAIGRYRGVSQQYCRKSRFNGPLSFSGVHLAFEVFQERELKEVLAMSYLVLQACILVSRCFRQVFRISVFALFAQNCCRSFLLPLGAPRLHL